jgi:hypothetical protein
LTKTSVRDGGGGGGAASSARTLLAANGKMAAAMVPRKYFEAILDELIRDGGQGVTFSFFVFMNSFLCLVSGF